MPDAPAILVTVGEIALLRRIAERRISIDIAAPKLNSLQRAVLRRLYYRGWVRSDRTGHVVVTEAGQNALNPGGQLTW